MRQTHKQRNKNKQWYQCKGWQKKDYAIPKTRLGKSNFLCLSCRMAIIKKKTFKFHLLKLFPRLQMFIIVKLYCTKWRTHQIIISWSIFASWFLTELCLYIRGPHATGTLILVILLESHGTLPKTKFWFFFFRVLYNYQCN